MMPPCDPHGSNTLQRIWPRTHLNAFCLVMKRPLLMMQEMPLSAHFFPARNVAKAMPPARKGITARGQMGVSVTMAIARNPASAVHPMIDRAMSPGTGGYLQA